VAKRELDRRARPRREAKHRDRTQLEVVEELNERIGLRSGAGMGGH
jgi:hypothetical protein